MATTSTIPDATTSTTPNFSFPTYKPDHVSKSAIVWISVLGALGSIAILVAIFYLLRFQFTRKARSAGHRVDDGRNEHKEWWKHANPPVDASRSDVGSVEMQGLTNHAVPPATTGSWPLAPEKVVEEDRVKSRYYRGSDLKEEKV